LNSSPGLSFHSGKLRPGDEFNYTLDENRNLDYFDNYSKSIRAGLAMNRSKNFSIANFTLEYKDNMDLSLLIDRSGSMAGTKIENVKKASGSLVQIIYPGDRVSIVKFADDANIANTFTDDRDILLASIDKLHAGGSTLYIPALEKAQENYELYSDEDAGKIVIFLSDGEPWDEDSPEGIYDTVTELIDSGICIYAIGYGEEVFEGSKSERILQQIVEQSQESTQCGNYKYSPSDDLRLTKIFGSIYHEAIGSLEGLKLESQFPCNYSYHLCYLWTLL